MYIVTGKNARKIDLKLIHGVQTDMKFCIRIQWTVLSLIDNYDEDEFQYLIHVHTGFKISSGTKSKVLFRVNGTEGETGVRKMDDGIREVPMFVCSDRP